MPSSVFRLPFAFALSLAVAGAGLWPAGATASAIDTRPVPAGPTTSALPAGWHHGAFIEIFVRAWKDSDGDGIGDLRGLTQTLDHLQDLGVRGIWLMPITPSADGDHGYATTDYRDIAPEYGTLADFDELLRQAHRRGIGVIMDYVINHSAAEHPMFRLARSGPGAPFRDWFVWSEEPPAGWDIWGKYPWYHTASEPWRWTGEVKDMPLAPPGSRGFYFGTFGPHMPDFDFRNPAVLDYHLDSLRFWLNRGLDGFRLDAVPHLLENSAVDWNDQPESRALTRRVQDEIRRYDHRYVVCEATAKPQDWGDPAVCGGAFAFGHVHHIVEAAKGNPESARKVVEYWATARPTMATFLSNHDIFAGRRLWDQFAGDERRMRTAAATYLLLPGTPFIYYGEPIGQAGVPGLPGDLPLRSPKSWTADPATGGFTTGRPFRPVAPNVATHNVAAQSADPRSLLNFYKAMIKLRNTHPSIARGRFEGGFAQGLVTGWQRIWEGEGGREHTLTLVNHDERPAAAEMSGLPPMARLVSAHPAGGAMATRVTSRGTATLLLAPHSVRVLVVSTGSDGTAGARAGRAERQAAAPGAKAKARPKAGAKAPAKAKRTGAAKSPSRSKAGAKAAPRPAPAR